MDRLQIERISKALADQTRLLIFEAIGADPHMNCSQIVKLQGVTPATVSHHMKILSDAGLIICEREGQFVYSRVNSKVVREYTRALANLASKAKRTALV